MSKKRRSIFSFIQNNLVYLLAFFAIISVAFFGSNNKKSNTTGSLNIGNIANNNFNISTDQLSEFYMVANTASSLSLANVDAVSSNYVIVTVMNEAGQSGGNTGSIEKPNIVDTSFISRGVITYTVEDGDTMASIAAKLKITTDQIRWSNGLKTTDISVGQVLYLPNTPGIVYTVKDGDSLSSIVGTYGSSVAKIVSQNNLGDRAIAPGDKIVLPGGTLPVKLRPEYVAPKPKPIVYNYSYSGATSARQNLIVIKRWTRAESMMGDGNPGSPGQCTWYAWYWRAHNPNSLGRLPGGLGNANSWANALRRQGYLVDHNPQVGAVFQTAAGAYGHVGVVIAINGDGSIVVREMNYGHKSYYETQATVPANLVRNFNYIH